LVAGAGRAAADDSLAWSPRFKRFSTAQYLLTGAMAGGLLATSELLSPRSEPLWQSDILLDAQARSLLGAHTEQGRERASSVSDYMVLGLSLYPFAIDALVVAGAVHGNFDVALQLGLIGLQGVLLARLVNGLTKNLVGRARPDKGRCAEGDALACGSENESFISGHTTSAFVGAGLICATHQNLNLYGSSTAGTVACGLSLGAATTVGALRIASGRHYMSDVLGGAAVGLVSGWLLPNLTNYDFGRSKREQDEAGDSALVPMLSKHTFGLSYVHTW
jgi:membrane-associated phospholipid phosphatase